MTAADDASRAAEAVRALNHATISLSGYTQPADVDATLSGLQQMAQRLPQALDQASEWMERALTEGRVSDDRGPQFDPRATVAGAVRELTLAVSFAASLTDALRAARDWTSHLAGVDDTTHRGTPPPLGPGPS